MTETHHDSAAPGGQGPRVPPRQMRDLNRLRRSTTDRKIAGVAGGIGRHLDIDPTVVRVLLVVLVFFGGAGLLIYGAFWLLVPEDGSDEAPIALQPESRTVALVVTLVVAALLLLGNGWWFGFDGGFPPPLLPLLIVGLVVWLLLRNRRSETASPQPPVMPPPPPDQPLYAPPPPPPAPMPPRQPRGRALFGITAAAIFLVLGTVAVVDVAGASLPWAVYPASALTVVGVAMVIGAFVGRSTGLTLLGLLAAGALALATWAPEVSFGEVDARPTSAAQLQDSYRYTAGRVELDLTAIRDLQRLDGRSLEVSVRTGEVIVVVPEDLDVEVVGAARGGRLELLGNVTEGRMVQSTRATPDTAAPDLRIHIDLGFGQAIVRTS